MRTRTAFRHSERGVTLIEASIILTVVATLTAVLAPSAAIYIEQARQARARGDLQTIGDAINEFVADNAEHQFLFSGNGGLPEAPPSRIDGVRVNLLVSDGDIPTLGSGVSGDLIWLQQVNNTTVSTLSNHLIQNTPGAGESAANQYRNPSDISIAFSGGNIDFARSESSGFNAPYAWRGAYLRGPVNSDPWGNRYAANVLFLDPEVGSSVAGIAALIGPSDYPRMDVFVLSAGADEEIDTAFAQDGAVPGDDDFIYLVSANAK